MAGLSWLRAGTIAVVNGSKNVTGTDTVWGNGVVNPGDIIQLPNGSFGEVEAIASNTLLTLKLAYTGATASAQAYAIIRMLPSGNVAADLAAGVQALLQRYNITLDQLMGLLDSSSVVSFTDGTTTLLQLSGLRKLMADIAARPALDASGNLGVGVTPASWAGYKALQVQKVGVFGSGDSGYLTKNVYYGASGPKLIGDGQALLFAMEAGTYRWYASQSGTAEQAASLVAGMTLEAGNLTVNGKVSSVMEHRSYTKATVPAASAYPGCSIYVADATGGASLAWSNGSTWTSIKTNAAI